MAKKVEAEALWAWMATGLGGCINFIDRGFEQNMEISDEALVKLKTEYNRLGEIIAEGERNRV